ncbi:hypothetical protein CN085_19585 [Sinorhizobium meliloti]|uniref:hypothetical protein n=1 Tax=Rhizobium meliloti TaxID=382 RepID=UPI000FD926B5|nr:hypothetical protein [Sinorhizobium meliloti]RVP13116.1 hypothetical protein CN085_19585 [Sinorhizobium meliloti]
MSMFDKEMQKALQADGEYLRQMTGEDHGPTYLATCQECDGEGFFYKRITVYEAGCGLPHDDMEVIQCGACGGWGLVEEQP